MGWCCSSTLLALSLSAWHWSAGCSCWRRCVALYCSRRKLNRTVSHICFNGYRSETTSHLIGSGLGCEQRTSYWKLQPQHSTVRDLPSALEIKAPTDGQSVDPEEKTGVRKSYYPDYGARLHVASLVFLAWCYWTFMFSSCVIYYNKRFQFKAEA